MRFQARKYFGHLATLKPNDPDVWLCLSIACAMADEFEDSTLALNRAKTLLDRKVEDIRIKFCSGILMHSVDE